MSLQAQPILPIPELTAQVAQAAFRKGNIYMQMRELLGTFFTDDQFVDLYPADGQPAYSPWRLALVWVMQFAENLTDRQAADAVRSRFANSIACGEGKKQRACSPFLCVRGKGAGGIGVNSMTRCSWTRIDLTACGHSML